MQDRPQALCIPGPMVTDPVARVGQFLQRVAHDAQQSPVAQHVLGVIGQWKKNALPGAPGSSVGRTRFDRARIVVPPRDKAFAAILPGDSVAEQVITTGLLNFLNLYNSALILRLVLTWFPSVPPAFSQPLATICDPYLNLFRGIIPPLGGTLDLSPILAFVTLNFFTSSAAALPCELGPDGKPARSQRQGWQQWMPPSPYQQNWARRVEAQKALTAASNNRSA